MSHSPNNSQSQPILKVVNWELKSPQDMMILGGLHQDLLRRVINGVTLKRVLNCFVGTAGVSGKPFTHCLLLIWAVFDAGYVARVILPNTDFSINFSF